MKANNSVWSNTHKHLMLSASRQSALFIMISFCFWGSTLQFFNPPQMVAEKHEILSLIHEGQRSVNQSSTPSNEATIRIGFDNSGAHF